MDLVVMIVRSSDEEVLRSFRTPAVPRIGESIMVGGAPGTWKVKDVLWALDDANAVTVWVEPR